MDFYEPPPAIFMTPLYCKYELQMVCLMLTYGPTAFKNALNFLTQSSIASIKITDYRFKIPTSST